MDCKNDFYNFINHVWLNNTEIPKGYSSWGTFNEIDKDNKEILINLIKNISKEDGDGIKVKTLFDQFLNRPNKLNDVIDDVNIFLSKIKNIKYKKDLNKFINEKFTSYGMSTPLMFDVHPDFDNSNKNILHISSNGLGLPDRDYYFDEKHTNILKKYKLFMKEYLQLFGTFDYNNIFLIEKELAECTYTKVQKRNPHLINNKFTLNIINCNFKDFYIKDTIKSLNMFCGDNGSINITNPTLIKKYYNMWKCITIKNWKDFYSWIYLRNIGTILSKETDKIKNNFYNGVLNGVYDMKSDEERAFEFSESKLGMILSKEYVKKYFPDDKRKMIIDLVNSIKITFRKKLELNKWMSENTKVKAFEKLEKMNFKIVSPNDGEWRNYSELIVSNDLSIIENYMNIKKFEYEYELSELNKPVDKKKWFMNPHQVNAYYSPNYNEIVFPAGILQGDFFGDNMIKNFGGIGVVIGHEITHGFDDEGRKFDSDGNLNNWFCNKDIKLFEERASKLKNQFDKLEIEGININGKLTLGENIADLGGVIISYEAMEEYMKDKVLSDEDKKMFFTSFAKIWKYKATPETIKLRVTTDPHSPPKYRVNQILGNFEPFIKLYDISENDLMYIDNNDRVDIW